MADPLSITSGVLSVITAATKTGTTIYKFIRDCKEARADLTEITRELSELTLILELIRDENSGASKGRLPNALQIQVQAMLTSCANTVQQIEQTLAKCRGKPGPLLWTLFEKEKVTALKSSLEAFKSGLNLVLETINLSVTREIKRNTETIEDNTVEIRRDVREIRHEINKLRDQLLSKLTSDAERVRLERWLDDVTQYAETIVCDEIDGDVSDTPSLFEHAGAQELSGDRATDLSATWNTGSTIASNKETSVQHGSQPLYSTRGASASRQVHLPISSEADPTVVRSGQQALSKRQPPTTSEAASKKQSPANHARDQIPYRIHASGPLGSNVISQDYCEARKVWAILYRDLTLSFWSHSTGKLIASLPVFRDKPDGLSADVSVQSSNCLGRVRFCPTVAGLVLVEGPLRQIEVWKWEDRARIAMPPGIHTIIAQNPRSRFNFVPNSTLIYAHDHLQGYSTVLYLSRPVRSVNVTLGHLPWPTQYMFNPDQYRFAHAELKFISKGEMLLIWKLSHAHEALFFGPPTSSLQVPPWLIVVYRIDGDGVNSIKQSRLTTQYLLQNEYTSIRRVHPVGKARRLVFAGSLNSSLLKLATDTTLEILNLDTGARLFEWHYSRENGDGWDIGSHKYVFLRHAKSGTTKVICLETGRNLGTIYSRGLFSLSRSNKAVFTRRAGSNIEFATTDNSLDELTTKW
ncbi:hypothetical protein F5Y14DRAFT_443482 [Nemania sp. NC0429]|nr:hypothetical protein F5Y14DRAFT_443482 [Nemania sp. NC0429]